MSIITITKKQLDLFNLLHSPIWVMDTTDDSIWWVNNVILSRWGESEIKAMRDDIIQNNDYLNLKQDSAQSECSIATYCQLNKSNPIRSYCHARVVILETPAANKKGILFEGQNAHNQPDLKLLRSVEALQYSSTMISMFSNDGALIYQNKSSHGVFGNNSNNFFTRFIEQETAMNIWQQLTAKKRYRHEHRFHTLSGAAWHNITCKVINDPLDDSTCILVNQIDLSNHKVMEAQLLSTEQRYQQIFFNNNAVMLLIDPDNVNIIDANKAAERFYGYSLASLKRMKMSEINTCSKQALSELIRNIVKGDISSFVTQHRNAAGCKLDVEVFSCPIRVNHAPVLYSIIHDVTDRLRAETALKQSQKRLLNAQKIAKIGNWEWNIAKDKLYWSNEIYAIFGYNPNELAITFDQFMLHVHEADRVKIKKAFVTLKNNRSSYFMQHRIVRTDGTERYINVEGHVQINNDSGEVEKIAGIIQDITENKMMQSSLQEAKQQADYANQTKSQFLANISHEIRTPLNAIIGYCEILLDDDIADGIMTDITRIYESSTHLLIIINNILDLSKIEAGKIEINRDTISIYSFLENIMANILPLATHNKNCINLECSPHIGDFVSDSTKVKQILYNLLSNACKFTKEGEITLQAHKDKAQNRIDFMVSDTGIGMSTEESQSIFEPFSQVDNSYTKKFQGTGLGLTISKHFCQMLDGNMQVTSERNVGTQFVVSLPVQNLRR